MKDIIYIHGFLSSPASFKAQQTKVWLEAHHPDVRFQCPALSSYPKLARDALVECVSACDSKPYVIGSSLGGFWSSYLIQSDLVEKGVLVNPAVSPHTRFREVIGQTLKSYYSEETFVLAEEDMAVLAECESTVVRDVSRYWVMLQTGDEVLDYRLAEQRYSGTKMLIEEGGDHSFQGFDTWLPEIMSFFADP